MSKSTLQVPPKPKRRLPGQLMLEFLRDRIGTLQRIQRECGSVARFTLWPVRFYLVAEPSLIEQIITEHKDDVMQGLPIQSAKCLFGSGLIAAEGQLHDRQKAVLEPMLAYDHVWEYADVIVECVETNRWQDGEIVDIQEEMRRLCLSVAGKVLVGQDLEPRATEMSNAMNEILRGIEVLDLPIGRLIVRLPLPTSLRFRRSLRLVHDVVEDMIEHARAADPGGASGLFTDLVKRGGMSEQQLHDEVAVALFATYLLNATALMWTWYLLSQNPEAGDKLHAELDEVLAGRPPTRDDLSRLNYTEMVVTETKRLYPPIWSLSRQLLKDLEVGGYALRKGAQIFLPQFLVHRDPQRFADPERFNPERWSSEESRQRPKLDYFPFGRGPRWCVGAPLGWTEQVLLVAAIARFWRFRLAADQRIKPKPWLVLFPIDGIRMIAERRT